ncbi:coiled-coil and C2 domain-containing protein 1B isoform X1 [Lepidochelys kempii]|uniref:coiled-coil and C2 domain-containing protein 1B isoform X1 n=2 Tax=Lepidochelys kempii TaxID=8472 RepID=UPI003C702C55
MLGRRPRKSPQAKGQGAAAAKQLGLFVDFNPEAMLLDIEDGGGDEDLEAELAAITGEKVTEGKSNPKRKTPLPMDHIEKMAAECMKDLNEEEEKEEDEGLEEDTDLLAELQEVLGKQDETGSGENETVAMEVLAAPPVIQQQPEMQAESTSPAVSSELQQMIEDRIANYKAAISNAKEADESGKARRYERGLKMLETMLAAMKKGKKINEEEMPPPVASGRSSANMPRATGAVPENLGDPDKVIPKEKVESPADHELQPVNDIKLSPEPASLQGHAAATSVLEMGATLQDDSLTMSTRTLLVTRQKEYKLAALKAKQQGDLEKAKEYMKTGKKCAMVLEALDSGQPVDLQDMPPAPQDLESLKKTQAPSNQMASVPVENSQPLTTFKPQGHEASVSAQQPKTVLEALQQRLEKYRSAAAQAKASGDDRKGRMHERIAKQYQDAIRTHKAGRKVNFAELPVPPGFPPIPGVTPTDGNSTIAAVLESANHLANMEEKEDEEVESESPTQAPVAKKPAQLPQKPTQVVKPIMVPSAVAQEEHSSESVKKAMSPSTPVREPDKAVSNDHLPLAASEQLEFLENRKKQYLKAAIKAKQKNDLEQAKLYLKTAKNLDLKIEQAKSGKSVDISKLPSPLTDDESDFIFIHHDDVKLSQKVEEVYAKLIKLLKDQHEKCLQYSRQFMHLGNITETARFEKLAEACKKDLEILQLAQAQGMDPPSHHFEERTFKIIRIFSELNSTEMHLIIVRGINLPAPPGVTPNDLDAFVKFEFHYPNTEQAQKSKTAVIKNTNSPEYNQLFKLTINRNHRGFRRVIQTKGIKFEIFHKGGLFRSDKQVGTAHLKLDKLESECEIREIIEILDGRKPTGGKLEVKVRLREPLSGQDLQTITENWLVLEH